VTLHHTGEALTLARADDVDELAGFEGVTSGDLLAEGVVRGVCRADLSDLAARRDACGGVVAGEGLSDLAGVDLAGGDLNGVTTFGASSITVTGTSLPASFQT
jgi:hypothetical protein